MAHDGMPSKAEMEKIEANNASQESNLLDEELSERIWLITTNISLKFFAGKEFNSDRRSQEILFWRPSDRRNYPLIYVYAFVYIGRLPRIMALFVLGSSQMTPQNAKYVGRRPLAFLPSASSCSFSKHWTLSFPYIWFSILRLGGKAKREVEKEKVYSQRCFWNKQSIVGAIAVNHLFFECLIRFNSIKGKYERRKERIENHC